MAVRHFAVVVPSDPCCLTHVRHFIGSVLERALAPDAGARVVLALDECCANVVRHRDATIGDGSIRCELEIHEPDGEPAGSAARAGRLRIRMRRFCRADDVERIRPRDLEDVRPGGIGTHIVAEIMDEVRFEPDPEADGCLSLILEKRVPLAPPAHDPGPGPGRAPGGC